MTPSSTASSVAWAIWLIIRNPEGHPVGGVFAAPARPVNLARYEFLNAGAADFLPQLEAQAAGAVALLRTEAGRDPYDRDLTDLVGELSTRSEKFRTLWAAHDVRLHRIGVKHFHHPAVGELSLPFEAMPIPPGPGLTLTALSAEPGAPSHHSLRLLAGWTATLDQDDQPDTAITSGEQSAWRSCVTPPRTR
ncbi:hypothetical protein ABZ656_28655 [Streptomyces sp. NPDC007095]|uniref:MmyB family transcriptional regulator n=1 Tax=Streptomyces sp. NPDC007095 TaxID=3154482 RepID=UPI0033D30ABC